MFIPDPDFIPSRIWILDPGVKKAPDHGSATLVITIYAPMIFTAPITKLIRNEVETIRYIICASGAQKLIKFQL
jgi:hypothetical protein